MRELNTSIPVVIINGTLILRSHYKKSNYVGVSFETPKKQMVKHGYPGKRCVRGHACGGGSWAKLVS